MSAMVPAVGHLRHLSDHGDTMVATLADSFLVLIKHIESLERQLEEERTRTKQLQTTQMRAPDLGFSLPPAFDSASAGPTFLKRSFARANP